MKYVRLDLNKRKVFAAVLGEDGEIVIGKS